MFCVTFSAATILRLQNYQLQKTLPLLLVVALLVNFSGVLVGFVVDMANIITNFFMGASINVPWATNPWGNSLIAAENVTQNIARILYFSFGAFVYFILLLLFAVRVIVLWTITILAPLAFAALVLPATRSLWSRWWSELLKWAMIGIPISFFMFLAGRALSTELPRIEGVGDALAGSLAPMSALFLLVIGVLLSFQFAPAGANAVINFGQKWGLRGAMATGSAAWRKLEGNDIKEGGGRISRLGSALRRRGEGPLAAIQSQIAKKDGRLNELLDMPGADLTQEEKEEIDTLDTEITGLKGKEEQAKEEQENLKTRRWKPGYYTGGLIARWAGRVIELPSKEVTMRMLQKDVREIEEAAREVADKDSFSVFNMINAEKAKGQFANKNRITGLLNGIRNREDFDDIEDAINSGALEKRDIGQAIKTGLRGGPPAFRPLLKSAFHQIMLHPKEWGFDATANVKTDEVTGNITVTFAGKDAGFLTAQLPSIPTKYTPQDFPGDTMAPSVWNTDTQEGKFFAQTIIRARGAEFMSAIGRRPKKHESKAFMEYLFKEGRHAQDGLGVDWLLDNNAEDVLRYLDSPGARSLGLGRSINRQQIENLVQAQRAIIAPTNELTNELANLRAELTSNPPSARTSAINLQIQKIEEESQWRGTQQDRSPAELRQELGDLTTSINNLARTQRETPNAFTGVMANQLTEAQRDRRRFAAELARRRAGSGATPGAGAGTLPPSSTTSPPPGRTRAGDTPDSGTQEEKPPQGRPRAET